MSKAGKVNIVPCSGIGKTFGSVSRLAAYSLTEDDRPKETILVPLALWLRHRSGSRVGGRPGIV